MAAIERENRVKKRECHLMPTTCNARKREKRRWHLMSSHARERETKKKVTFNANHMNIREKKKNESGI